MYTYENQPIDELIDEICAHYPDLEGHMRRIEDFYERSVHDLVEELSQSKEGLGDEIESLEQQISDLEHDLARCYEETDDLEAEIDSLLDQIDSLKE